MSKQYLPYDEDLTMDQNISRMIVWEIENTTPRNLLAQNNPFIYLMSVKNMVFTGKLGLSMQLADDEKRAMPIVTPMVARELDLLLAGDELFNSRRMSATEFTRYFINTLLPSSPFALYLKRDD